MQQKGISRGTPKKEVLTGSNILWNLPNLSTIQASCWGTNIMTVLMGRGSDLEISLSHDIWRVCFKPGNRCNEQTKCYQRGTSKLWSTDGVLTDSVNNDQPVYRLTLDKMENGWRNRKCQFVKNNETSLCMYIQGVSPQTHTYMSTSTQRMETTWRFITDFYQHTSCSTTVWAIISITIYQPNFGIAYWNGETKEIMHGPSSGLVNTVLTWFTWAERATAKK